MTSPFPGMDPFLEGYIWPDFHNELASKIRRQLMPLLQPKYFAHLNIYVAEDKDPGNEIGIMYPDVEVMQNKVEEPIVAYGSGSTITPSTYTVLFQAPIEWQIPVIEIKNTADKKLITSIEILSPVNKKKSGLDQYLEKRVKLHQNKVHLLEIDLLRRGIRPVKGPKVQLSDYMVALTRAGEGATEIWSIDLQSVLPTVPVPLLPEDTDVSLDLQRAFMEVYAEAGYHVSIDYGSEIPPPNLTEENKEWVDNILKK